MQARCRYVDVVADSVSGGAHRISAVGRGPSLGLFDDDTNIPFLIYYYVTYILYLLLQREKDMQFNFINFKIFWININLVNEIQSKNFKK